MKYSLLAMAFALNSLNGFAANLATVNGVAVTESEFKEAVQALGPNAAMVSENPEMRERFLRHMIENRILAERATKEGIDKTDLYKSRLEQARSQILSAMYIEDYIAKKATDKALKDHFNKNKASFSKEEIKASHILVDNEAKAKEVLAAVKKKGADFGALAKEHSTGPTGPNGGDLGWFGRGRMVPEFEEAAFKTKAGQIHDNIVKTRFGYHIIKVDEKKGEGEVKFDDVKTNVEAQLKQELRQNLSEQLDKDAKIEIDAKALSAMKLN